ARPCSARRTGGGCFREGRPPPPSCYPPPPPPATPARVLAALRAAPRIYLWRYLRLLSADSSRAMSSTSFCRRGRPRTQIGMILLISIWALASRIAHRTEPIRPSCGGTMPASDHGSPFQGPPGDNDPASLVLVS